MAAGQISTGPTPPHTHQTTDQVPTSSDKAGSSEKKSLTMTVISTLMYPISHKVPPEHPDRGNWNNRAEFVLSCMGLAIGLGNLWRFPFKVYDNGGGSFIVAYLVMLVILAFPNFLLELAIGQFSSAGPVQAYKNIMPLWTGMGWLNVIANFIAVTYYTPMMAYSLFYLFSSFQTVMPWQTCEVFGLYWTCVTFFCQSHIKGDNNWGLTWQMTLCHYLAWFLTAVGLMYGPKVMGKIVYFTAIFPIVIILVFVIYSATLRGSRVGYSFYLRTNWSRLAEINVWKDAAVQIFASLSVGGGGMMTLASYNVFRNDFVVDAGIVAFANCMCSFISGFAVFAICGDMAVELGRSIPEVVDSGMGLAFIAYSHVTSYMPAGQLWAVLWFLNLFVLGIDSNFAMMEVLITCFCDKYPSARNHRWTVVTIMSAILSLIGLVNITRGGSYFIAMVDESVGYLFVVSVLSNVIMISYIYGAFRFTRDIQMMLGMTIHGPDGRTTFGSLMYRKYSKWYSIVAWAIVTPVVFGTLLIASFIKIANERHFFTGSLEVPVFGKLLYWSVGGSAFPLFMIWCALYSKYCNKYSWRQMIQPTKQWGPALNEYREHPYEKLKSHSQSDEKPGLMTLLLRKFDKNKAESQLSDQKDRTEPLDRDILDKPIDDIETVKRQPTGSIEKIR